MTQLIRRSGRSTRSVAAAVLLLLDFTIGLLPPLHWITGQGAALPSLGYFVGAATVITLSLFVLVGLDRGAGDEA